MPAGVLFDHPGPQTKARHRLYTVVALIALAVVVGLAVWRLYDRGQFKYEAWEVLLTPNYIEAILVDGVLKTLQMAALSIIFSLIFGVVFGVGKLSNNAIIAWACWAIVEFFRAVPVLLLMVFIYFGLLITYDNWGSFWAVVIALTLYNGSVLAEVIRAGINAVPKGQGEAAAAIGMTDRQVTMQVQLPQAVRIMFPSIISQAVVALKDTSLGYYIVAPALTTVGQQIFKEISASLVPVVFVLAAIYILLNLALTWILTKVQKLLFGNMEAKPEAEDQEGHYAAIGDAAGGRSTAR